MVHLIVRLLHWVKTDAKFGLCRRQKVELVEVAVEKETAMQKKRKEEVEEKRSEEESNEEESNEEESREEESSEEKEEEDDDVVKHTCVRHK